MTVFSSLSSALVLCVALNFILAIGIEAKRPLAKLSDLLCAGGCGSWELQGPNRFSREKIITFKKVMNLQYEMPLCTRELWLRRNFPCKFVDKEAARDVCDHKVSTRSNSEKSGPKSSICTGDCGPWALDVRTPDYGIMEQSLITFKKDSHYSPRELPLCGEPGDPDISWGTMDFPCKITEEPSDELCSLMKLEDPPENVVYK